MGTVSAKDAKYNFGKRGNLARVAAIAVTKYDRAVERKVMQWQSISERNQML
jgi:hypothetical protein